MALVRSVLKKSGAGKQALGWWAAEIVWQGNKQGTSARSVG
jgi:hypothetical protein